MVKIEELSYKNYGKCVKLSNDNIELIATLEVGPRIIHFSTVGGENVFFEDIERNVNKDGYEAEFEEVYGEGTKVWEIIGGHRVWTSPEALPRSYYPSVASEYERIENGIRLISPVQKWNNLQSEFEITVIGDNEVKVIQKWRNCGAWPVEFAVWALTVADKGGTEIIPQPDRKTGLLHNRILSLWDYTDMADERITWGKKYIKLQQDSAKENNFKLGINNEAGYALYFNKGDLFVKKYDTVIDGNYPDGGVSFETFTGPYFLEIETLGELKTVGCGEVSAHTEYWKLFGDVALPETDEQIDEIVEKYV